ncbi:MAG: hypothetical protein ACYC46_01385 [Acidobacteriaceae bacterium]
MPQTTPTLDLSFAHAWSVEILPAPPLIAPARQFTYPQQIAGEEDALARGALYLTVHPSEDPPFLATCALGFADPSVPTGVWACPNPQQMCAVAGGYAYVLNTQQPETCTQIALRPVVEVRAVPDQNLLLFAGFHTLYAWGAHGQLWQTKKLSWEGIRLTEIHGHTLHGFGWELMTDKEVAFAVDLRTGEHTGGPFNA